VLVLLLGGDNHIVYVCLHISPYHRCEHLVHQPLIGRTNVLEPKGHHLIAITEKFCHECCFAFVPGCIRIWLYPEKASKKLRSLHPDALFKSVKSTQLHFPLAFFTNTTFANNLGYWISLMWPTLSRLWVSSLMTRRLSSLNFLRFWRTSRTFGFIVRRWLKKSGSMPSMYEADHVKASRCYCITSSIWSCASWPRDLSSLNFLPPIYLSSTSPAGLGRLSRDISARETPFRLAGDGAHPSLRL